MDDRHKKPLLRFLRSCRRCQVCKNTPPGLLLKTYVMQEAFWANTDTRNQIYSYLMNARATSNTHTFIICDSARVGTKDPKEKKRLGQQEQPTHQVCLSDLKLIEHDKKEPTGSQEEKYKVTVSELQTSTNSKIIDHIQHKREPRDSKTECWN